MSVSSDKLVELSDLANSDLTGGDVEDSILGVIDTVHSLKASLGWSSLEGDEVRPAALTRALGDIMKLPDTKLRVHAASAYVALLALKDSPVGALCEPYAFVAFVHCLRSLCLPPSGPDGGRGATQQDDAAAESIVSPLALMDDLRSFLANNSLLSCPELFSVLLDAIIDMTESTLGAGGGRVEKGNKRGGAGPSRNQGGSVAEAAFAVLPKLLDGRHGDLLRICAAVCSRLLPTLMSTDVGAKRGGNHGFDRRAAALSFVTNRISANPAARPALVPLMQHLCLWAPDKADARQQAAATILALMSTCNAAELRQLCLFLYCLSQNTKINNRLVAVEVAGALLNALPAPFARAGAYQRLLDGSAGAGAQLDAPWSAVCLGILVRRAIDKSASVRSKAISCLADTAQAMAKRLEDRGPEGDAAAFVPAICASRCLKITVTAPKQGRRRAARNPNNEEDDSGEEGGPAGGAADEDDDEDAEGPSTEQAKFEGTMPGRVCLDLAWLTELCHDRCRDEKAAVRKAALQLLDSSLQLASATSGAAGAAAAAGGSSGAPSQSSGGPTAADVRVLEEATADTLVSVRKTALQVICNLVASHPDHAGLAAVWARCVLPMIRDPESAVQDTVLDRLTALLLDPIAALAAKSKGRGGGSESATAEVRQRLAALAQVGRVASACLGKALTVLAAKKLLRGPQVAAGLEAFLTAAKEPAGAAAPTTDAGRAARRHLRDQREGAWILLSEVAGQDPAAPSWKFLQGCWAELQAGDGSGGDGGSRGSAQEGAMLLWVISHAASRFPAGEASELASGLLTAVLGFNMPCPAVAAHLAALHKLTQSEGGQALVGAPPEWCARVMAASEEVLGGAIEARGQLSPSLATRCQIALFTLGEVVMLREAKLPGGALTKAQALISGRAAVAGSGAGPAGKQGKAGGGGASGSSSSAVQAHAWICLGKMCMVDEDLAKKFVRLLVHEMSHHPSPAVRTDLLVALSDMVVQFTGLADGFVRDLAAMVCDPHELVRRQALALLANLLLRDYVKWRGALVHRFLLALVDESPDVRQLAQYLLSDSLAAKAPMLAYNHFVESLFVLNDCSAGLHANRAGGGGGGSELAAELALHNAMEGGAFHLKGSTPIMRAKRDIIYTALLRRMKPEQRFAASARLVGEVLAAVADGLLPLGQAGVEEMLGDALRLLACKDMKINTNRFGAGAEDDGAAEPSGTQEEANKARGKLVGVMIRKHLAESVIPVMVELRHLLQAQKSPVLGSLMLCMATLLRDHKSEIEEILVADKQLAREIMHDLKHYDTLYKQQQQQQEAAMAAALKAGPAADARGQAAAAAGGSRPRPSTSTLTGAAAAGGPGAAAVAGGATPAAAHRAAPGHAGRMMPPAPHPPGADMHRRKSVLPGVEPSRTPIAAEVLATASKRRTSLSRHQHLQLQLQQQTPGAALTGAPPGPGGGAGGIPAGAKTPAATLGAGGAANTLFTPRTGLLGTGQRGLAAGLMGGMPSPAPLSAMARAQQQQHRTAVGLSPAPSAALTAARTRARQDAGGGAGPGAAEGAGAAALAADPPPRVVVLNVPDLNALPRPPTRPAVNDAAAAAWVAQQEQQQAQQHQQAPGRTPLAAAVQAARRVAAAVEAGEGGLAGDDEEAAVGVGVGVKQEAVDAAAGRGPSVGPAPSAAAAVVKPEPGAQGADNNARISKRRRGGA